MTYKNEKYNLTKEKFKIDVFLVDPEANLLIRENKEKRIEPKLMSLLCLLASKSKQVLTREEISKAIWPEVIVGDESITRAIFSLRNLLGDDSKQPRYIETIPKKGYRFLVEPQKVPSGSKIIARKNVVLYAIYAIIIVVISTLATGTFYHNNSKKLSLGIVSPLTQNVGSENQMSLSPSNKHVAYIYNDGNQSNLHIKSLVNNKVTSISNDNATPKYPQWLDNNTLAYIRCMEKTCDVVKQTEQTKEIILYSSKRPLRQMTVDKNKKWLVFNEYVNKESIELKRIDLLSGQVKTLRDDYPLLPKLMYYPSFSMISNELYFTSNGANGVDLIKLNFENNQHEIVSSDFSLINGFSFLTTDQLVIAATFQSIHGLWLLSPHLDAPHLLLKAAGSERIVGVEADLKNQRILYENFQSNKDIVYIDDAIETPKALLGLNSNADEYYGTLTEDGKSIYFVSNRTGFHELWRYDVAEKTSTQITSLNAIYILLPILSHNNQYAAIAYQTSQVMLGVVELKTGKMLMSRDFQYIQYPLNWNKEDKYFYASDYQKQFTLYRYDLETLTQEVVHKNGWLQVRDVNDESSIILADYQQGAIVGKDKITGTTQILSDTISGINSLVLGQLSISKDSVVALNKQADLYSIYQYPLGVVNKGSAQKTLDLSARLNGKQGSVTYIRADGKVAMMTIERIPQGDIMQADIKNN